MADDQTRHSPDDEVLDYTRTLRKKIIEDTMPEGKVPNNSLSAKLLMDSLGALEKVAITNKRLSQDKESAESDAQLAVQFAKYISANISIKKPTETDGDIPSPDSALLDSIPLEDFELSGNDNSMTYQEFKDKMDSSK